MTVAGVHTFSNRAFCMPRSQRKMVSELYVITQSSRIDGELTLVCVGERLLVVILSGGNPTKLLSPSRMNVTRASLLSVNQPVWWKHWQHIRKRTFSSVSKGVCKACYCSQLEIWRRFLISQTELVKLSTMVQIHVSQIPLKRISKILVSQLAVDN